MAYLGNPAVDRFTSTKSASVYSGDGSAVAFTLEHSVGSDEDILVSVDGVIQEPSVAYEVSSGTTLTFTAAPSTNSGNNIFVYYLFKTIGTVTHPATSALSATSGTFTGNVTAAGTLTVAGATTLTTKLATTNLATGAVVQLLGFVTGAAATGNTALVHDNTIPQKTEGIEVMTLAITPKSASNKLFIQVTALGSVNGANRYLVMALFKDDIANALSVTATFESVQTGLIVTPLNHFMTAGTTSEITFKVRMGANSTDTFTFNGDNGNRQFGGVANSSITITEIAV